LALPFPPESRWNREGLSGSPKLVAEDRSATKIDPFPEIEFGDGVGTAERIQVSK